MKYYLLYLIITMHGAVTGQSGPYNDLFACEKAATQIRILALVDPPSVNLKPHPMVETVCSGTNAYREIKR